MSKAEIAKRNFTLAARFNSFVLRNPRLVESLPSDAQVVFISGSRFLREYNLKLGKTICETTKSPVYKAIEKNKRWVLEEMICG